MFFKWLRKTLGGSSMNDTRSNNDVLDLGDPQRPLGHSAFVRGGGGGVCPGCNSCANYLHEDGKCDRCTSNSLTGKGGCDTGCNTGCKRK